MKSTKTAYLLMLGNFIAIAGLNRFYVGKIGSGLLYLFTFGLFGIGTIYDLFVVPNQVRYANLLKTGGVNNQQVVVNVVNNVEQKGTPMN
jgi:TM2 domain-containing membrane protein YozV